MSVITYLTTIRFEFGAINGIRQDLTDLGIRKPLIIADEGVAKAGLVGKITAVIDSGADLSGADLPVFTGTPTNPTEEAVEAALSMYAERGCDGLIAVGGGSPIDLAKGVALLATHDGPLEQYAAILGHSEDHRRRCSGHCCPDDGRDGKRGRAGVADHAEGRAEAGVHLPASHSQARGLRSRTDAGPSGMADRRDRDGRGHALRRNLSQPARQPAGGSDRA